MQPNAESSLPRDEAGLTLIELMVVMAIASVLMGIGGMGFVNWRNTSQHQGSADRVVSEFRRASVLAVSEGRTHCVELRSSQRDTQLWRYTCGTGTALGDRAPVQGDHPGFTLSGVPTATASTPCPASSKCVYFYPRGTATPATVVVTSTKRSKTYSVRVEGLTSRVYL